MFEHLQGLVLLTEDALPLVLDKSNGHVHIFKLTTKYDSWKSGFRKTKHALLTDHHSIRRLAEDRYIRLEDVEVEGWSLKSTVPCPVVSITDQQAFPWW